METFAKRLRHLMDLKKTNQQAVADGASVQRSRVSVWLHGKAKEPRRDTIQKLSGFFGCDIEWLATGEGEPFPQTKTEKVAEKPATDRRFVQRRQEDLAKDAAASMKRDRFKMQCAGYFDELFDFVCDRYGDDREAVDDFLDKLERLDSNFKAWRDEKKQARASSAALRGGAKIANNGEQ